MIELWIMGGVLGAIIGCAAASVNHYLHAKSLDEECEERYLTASNRAADARDQVVALLDQLDDALRENRNLREDAINRHNAVIQSQNAE